MKSLNSAIKEAEKPTKKSAEKLKYSNKIKETTEPPKQTQENQKNTYKRVQHTDSSSFEKKIKEIIG